MHVKHYVFARCSPMQNKINEQSDKQIVSIDGLDTDLGKHQASGNQGSKKQIDYRRRIEEMEEEKLLKKLLGEDDYSDFD